MICTDCNKDKGHENPLGICTACGRFPRGQNMSDWFDSLGKNLRAQGRLYPCTVCGKERDSVGCLECEERELAGGEFEEMTDE